MAILGGCSCCARTTVELQDRVPVFAGPLVLALQSPQIMMLPARFQESWEVLETDNKGMSHESAAGNNVRVATFQSLVDSFEISGSPSTFSRTTQ